MAIVAVTRDEVIEQAIDGALSHLALEPAGARLGFWSQGVRHLWEAGTLGLGEADVERVRFPALSMKEAIGAFTEAAYGKRLTFEHP